MPAAGPAAPALPNKISASLTSGWETCAAGHGRCYQDRGVENGLTPWLRGHGQSEAARRRYSWHVVHGRAPAGSLTWRNVAGVIPGGVAGRGFDFDEGVTAFAGVVELMVHPRGHHACCGTSLVSLRPWGPERGTVRYRPVRI
jgi:hypothetical protein